MPPFCVSGGAVARVSGRPGKQGRMRACARRKGGCRGDFGRLPCNRLRGSVVCRSSSLSAASTGRSAPYREWKATCDMPSDGIFPRYRTICAFYIEIFHSQRYGNVLFQCLEDAFAGQMSVCGGANIRQRRCLTTRRVSVRHPEDAKPSGFASYCVRGGGCRSFRRDDLVIDKGLALSGRPVFVNGQARISSELRFEKTGMKCTLCTELAGMRYV